jgi:hypothetical protein
VSDPSSQQTVSETSSQSSQPQDTFQQRPTNNSPRHRTNFRQRGFQQRTTRGRPITRTYHGYPYSLTVDLPPREDISSQKQQQLDLPPSREDISSQKQQQKQQQLGLPPSREDISSQKQQQLGLPPSRDILSSQQEQDISSQKQQQLNLPSRDILSSQQEQDISSQKQPQFDLPSRDIVSSQQLQLGLPSQHKQVDIRQQSDLMKRYRVPKSYAAVVSGAINPSRDPMKHEETETEIGTHNSHNSNLLLRSLVTFTNHIHVSFPSQKFKK